MISLAASIKLPGGWKFATSLPVLRERLRGLRDKDLLATCARLRPDAARLHKAAKAVPRVIAQAAAPRRPRLRPSPHRSESRLSASGE